MNDGTGPESVYSPPGRSLLPWASEAQTARAQAAQAGADAEQTRPGGSQGRPARAGARTEAPRAQRADAVRNRERLLVAAARIHAREGIDGLRMDDVAREAGVGKGTIYRRFGDKAGLASALLDHHVRPMHAGMVSGPPPLGPGAGPRARLTAFVHAYVRHMSANLDLVLLAESVTPGGRLGREVYPFWRQHVQILVAAMDAESGSGGHGPVPPARFRAEAIMAILAAAQLQQWLVAGGWAVDELVGALARTAVAIAAGAE